MSAPCDRWGVFLIPRERESELAEASVRVDAAMIGEHGEVGPRGWYEARHELFEKLVARSAFHRVIEHPDPDEVVARFVKLIDGRKRGAWGAASPAARRDLARGALPQIQNDQLRAALEAALAHPAASDAGLWVAAEAALPPMYAEQKAAARSVSPAEVAETARRLDELVVRGDEEWARRDRTRDRSPFRASLCELAEDDARAAANVWNGIDEDDLRASVRAHEQASERCLAAATARDDVDTVETVEAIEELCERIPIGSLARHIYDARQTRELLAWLERQRPSAARDRVLPALRSAASNGNAFAIVYFAE